MTPPHFNTYQSSYNNPQLQQQFSPSQYGSIQPKQQYSSHYPSQNQFNHSSIPPSHAFQSQMNHQTSTVPQVIPQVAYQSPQAPTQLMTESPFVDSGFAIPVFSPGDDLTACLNKAIAFLTAVASSRFPTTNNQLRTSSNLRNQATIQDGRVTVQQAQGRQGQTYSGTTYKSNATSSRGNTTSEQARVVKCYNYQGEGHMARQCTQPKRPRNAAWYKEKAMLAEAQEAGQILEGSTSHFLADPEFPQSSSDIIPHNAAFQTEDLDTYDFDCMISSTAQTEKANNEQNNESITAELERYKERVKTFEQRLNIDLSSREKMIDSQMDDMIREKLALKEQIDSLEQNLSKQIKEKESLFKTFTVFKNESKEKENKYLENEIDLEKKIKELDNIVYKVGQSTQTVHMLTKPQAFYDNTHKQALGYQNPFYLKKAQRIKPTLYDGAVMSKTHVAIPVIDDEETLILEEESQSKMFEKEKDPEVFKDQFDSIKQTRVLHKKQSDSLINKLNLKSVEIKDLKAQIQDKVFVITSLKNDLRKLKGKEIVENVVHIPSANTIALGMFKLDLEPFPHRKVAVTPINNVKKVRFAEPLTSSSNSKTQIKPPDNKKNDRISQTPSRNKKNKGSNATAIQRLHSLHEVSKMILRNDQIARIMGPENKFSTQILLMTCLNHSELLSIPKQQRLRAVMYGTGPIISSNFVFEQLAKDDLHKEFLDINSQKEQFSSACALGKSKKSSHQPKAEDTNQEKLNLLHMDLCGPIRYGLVVTGKRIS
ncbi:hypothetical protein Tco_0431582 [Tanacetum coccineum]